MSSALIGNQPLAGRVDGSPGVLLKNLGTVDVVCTMLEFCNIGGIDDVAVDVYQPDGSYQAKLKHFVLDDDESFQDAQERILKPGDTLMACASRANTVQWRANIKELCS